MAPLSWCPPRRGPANWKNMKFSRGSVFPGPSPSPSSFGTTKGLCLNGFLGRSLNDGTILFPVMFLYKTVSVRYKTVFALRRSPQISFLQPIRYWPLISRDEFVVAENDRGETREWGRGTERGFVRLLRALRVEVLTRLTRLFDPRRVNTRNVKGMLRTARTIVEETQPRGQVARTHNLNFHPESE